LRNLRKLRKVNLMAISNPEMDRDEALAILKRQDDRTLVLIATELLTAQAAEQGEQDQLEAWRDVLGPKPDATELRKAAAFGLVAEHADRATVVSGSLSRTQAARVLGVSPQAISAMRRQGRLVALTVGRDLIFPAWQFDAETSDGRLSGLDEILRRYPGSVVSLSIWMTTENPDLRGMSPQEVIHNGQLDTVLALIDSLTSSGW
jgi:hypothetical protein